MKTYFNSRKLVLFIIHNKMLVLNTNQDWGGAYLSNQNYMLSYPEFKNSILLFPTWDQQEEITIESVSWTQIHRYFTEMEWISYFWDNYSNSWIVWVFLNNSGSNFQKSVSRATLWKLDAWTKIWKKIVLPKLFWMTTTNNAVNISGGVFKQAFLLHSDWTKTFIAQSSNTLSWNFSIVDSSLYKSFTINWRAYYITDLEQKWWISYPVFNSNVITNNDSFIAQEWDRLWFALTFKIQWASSQRVWVWFWLTYTQDPELKIKPIQISVDD